MERIGVEQPSGKVSGDENFPVGSWLLPARLRPHIFTYYTFARTIDDIADSPVLDAAEKLRRLEGFERVVVDGGFRPGYEKASAMRESLSVTGISPTCCLDLIAAFRQDAIKSRYDTWQELLDYCQLSAAPVGRYLVDLHGASRDRYGASDALCAALQIINHIQDLKSDYLELDRIYLPLDWMEQDGVDEKDLSAHRCSPALRATINRMLAGVDGLLAVAAGIGRTISSRRLSLEATVILNIAHALREKLSRMDPVEHRVVLSGPELAMCAVRGFYGYCFD